MPTLLDENLRPERMKSKASPIQDFSDEKEKFYRHCHPDFILQSEEGFEILEAAVQQFNLSVLRSHFSEADDARWESAIACAPELAQVYNDFFVIEMPVPSAMQTAPPTDSNASSHSLRPSHQPYEDNYAHCELRLFRDDPEKWFKKEGDVKPTGKAAKRLFREQLRQSARVALKPFEGSPIPADN